MESVSEAETVGLYIVSSVNSSQRTSSGTKRNASGYIFTSHDHAPDTQCGIGSWAPRWLQVAASPKLFLFCYSMAGLSLGALFANFVGCMSTIEKRFAFDTKKSGLIMIAYEIGPVAFGALFGYFGGLAHRPRMLTISMLIASLSSFSMALPYFIYGPGRFDATLQRSASRISGVNAQFCDKDFNDLKEVCSASITIPSLLIFLFSNFSTGICGTIFYSIGTSYIDDTMKKKDSPIYLGTLITLRLFGPIFGFLLSSYTLQFYEDPSYDPGYGPSDPRWVGAWWLGFVILATLTFIFSLPIMLFPKHFAKNENPKKLKKSEKEVRKSSMEQLKDMGKAMKRLGKNPILLSHCLGHVFRFIGLIGYYLLQPKYMEMQFRQTASKSSLYTGPVSIVGMQLGIMLGGFSIHRFKPKPRTLAGSIAFSESFTVMAMLACMFITCPFHEMQEATTGINPLFHPENECNADCMCTTKVYSPVCGPDGKSTYFSPCHAGCSDYNKTGEDGVFTLCKCVHSDRGEFVTGDANKGYCGFECQWLITYIIILSLGKALSSTARVGNTLVALRCVHPADKCISLGATYGVYSLLAFIPFPVIYGSLTDSCCLVWEKSCGTTGNCWVYDVNKFRYLLHGVSAAFVFLGLLFDILVWYFSSRLRNLYDEEDADEKFGEPITNTEVTNYGGM